MLQNKKQQQQKKRVLLIFIRKNSQYIKVVVTHLFYGHYYFLFCIKMLILEILTIRECKRRVYIYIMKSLLNVDLRNEIGTNGCNRLRDNGLIPGVLYGYDIKTFCIEVDRKQLNNLIKEHGSNALINVGMNGETMNAIIKEVQRDPLTNDIVHVDLQTVSYDKPVYASVPIVLVDREKVENNNATIQHQLRNLDIECLPQNMPESIEISVKDLALGKPLRIADVAFSSEISVLNNVEEVIASLAHVEKTTDKEEESDDES